MATTPPRTPRDMTARLREIEQRLPRRKRPSLPAVSMERADSKASPKPSVEPVTVPERRHVVEINTNVSAGQDRSRAPQRRAQTLVERQYSSGHFQWEQNATATTVWNLVAEVRGGSEGVSNYSGERGSGAPWGKGDRKALAALRNVKKVKELADLIYAMAGIPSQDGRKLIDHELAVFIVRACVQTVDGITLAEIGKARSEYGTKNRQEAAGSTVLAEALRKGAGHLGYARAPEWRHDVLRRLIYGPGK